MRRWDRGTERQRVRRPGKGVRTSKRQARGSGQSSRGWGPGWVPALTMRSGGGVLPMKHSTLPPSPLTAYCTASLEIMGGPASEKTRSGPVGTCSPCSQEPPPQPTQATHHSHKVAPPAQPLRSEARWPGRCRCRHLPGSPTSEAVGCCYSEPGQREQPRVGSQEAWAPRSVRAPHWRHWKESRKGHR